MISTGLGLVAESRVVDACLMLAPGPPHDPREHGEIAHSDLRVQSRRRAIVAESAGVSFSGYRRVLMMMDLSRVDGHHACCEGRCLLQVPVSPFEFLPKCFCSGPGIGPALSPNLGKSYQSISQARRV
jgi:hypothetical protein